MYSNAYTYKFITILTGIAALLLSMAATGLRDRQEFNKKIEREKNVLISVGIYEQGLSSADVEKRYRENIHSEYVTEEGALTSDPQPLQIFVYGPEDSPKGYVIPVSGKGLWSTIHGFLALQPDLNTVAGITFYEHGETPGLGGEIEKDWFTSQFKGKKIYDQSGRLVSIHIAKGKALQPDDHTVDGISGATLTGNGVNKFLKSNLSDYENFFKSNR
ncbi:MAG: NADH:ubiquinone reductase (Na(+)-transporting) subunit C [FCB group bacterium]|nr:NADH:ubiquinone reductase (Na(+)-transporting) subunit C [FCB group bacterium]